MNLGDRVQTITKREGVVIGLSTDGVGRLIASVRLDSDCSSDLPLDIPAGCLRVLETEKGCKT